MARPTIRDVAREAGVGLGTVSRVLAGSTHVAESTRKRVVGAIERLGYHPSASARALSQGRGQAIEVIAPLLTRYYYFEVLRGILLGLADTDYCLNVRVLERPADRDRTFAEVDRRGLPDGLLVLRVRPTEELLARLAHDGVPVVLVDNGFSDPPGVGVDHRASAVAMVEHLLLLGHERVAFVDRVQDAFDQAILDSRRTGYREALTRAGIKHRAEYEPAADWSAEGGAAALERLLALPEPPTGIFAGSDTQAIGIIDRARQRGLAVPGDLAVCGYGDIELGRYLGLTTVRVPMQSMGEIALRMLLGAMDERRNPFEHTVLPVDLVVRSTCGPPRKPAQASSGPE
jgi:DNA-binding LacI/PurR family transcriptional regulator